MTSQNLQFTVNTEVERDFDTVYVSFQETSSRLSFRVAFDRLIDTAVLNAAVQNFPRMFADYVRDCADSVPDEPPYPD